MSDRYVIDTNVFIQAKNREYRFDFAIGFWNWLETGHDKGLFFSCSKVLAELRNNDPKKTCPARKWAEAMPARFFLNDVTDGAVMKHYSSLMNWVISTSQYTPAAVKEFADWDEADAFVVAVAKHHGMTVVTHEKASETASSWVPLPSAADALDVPTVTIYDLLSRHANATFAFKA